MTATRPTMASFWLMPAPADAQFLAAIVGELAARFDAPAFAPHLTVAGDVAVDPAALSAELAALAGATRPFSTPVADIVTGAAYFQSFYASFERAGPLLALKRAAVAAGLGGQEGSFTPHVSLLYGHPEEAAKQAAAREMRDALAGRTIAFDRIALTNSSQATPIAEWRIVADAPLR